MAIKMGTFDHAERQYNSPNNKMSLSKSILEMKFMKRTKDKVEEQLYRQEGEEYFCNQLTTRMKKSSGRFIIEPSFVFCEELIDGRLSFQGENPEIERIMELEEEAKRQKSLKTGKDMKLDISDEQIANWKLSNNRKTKFIKNDNVNSSTPGPNFEPDVKKRKFLKPEY